MNWEKGRSQLKKEEKTKKESKQPTLRKKLGHHGTFPAIALKKKKPNVIIKKKEKESKTTKVKGNGTLAR